MAIYTDGTKIKKIFVGDTEVFSCYKFKERTNLSTNYSLIWRKPFDFSAPNCGAELISQYNDPSRPSSFILDHINDEVYASSRISIKERTTFTLYTTSVTKLNGWTVSFLEDGVNKGNLTLLANRNSSGSSMTPTITYLGGKVDRVYSPPALNLSSSINIDNNETLTLSDFDSIQVTSNQYTWTVSNVNFTLFDSISKYTYTHSGSSLFGCYEITVQMPLIHSYYIEPWPLLIGNSISFYIGDKTYATVPYIQIIVTRTDSTTYTVQVGTIKWPYADTFKIKLTKIVT